MKYIDFDLDKARRLEEHYKVAVDDGMEMFEFEGQEYVTNYAKYLLEYLEDKLQPKARV